MWAPEASKRKRDHKKVSSSKRSTTVPSGRASRAGDDSSSAGLTGLLEDEIDLDDSATAAAAGEAVSWELRCLFDVCTFVFASLVETRRRNAPS